MEASAPSPDTRSAAWRNGNGEHDAL